MSLSESVAESGCEEFYGPPAKGTTLHALAVEERAAVCVCESLIGRSILFKLSALALL